jgi:hypothetical protein
MNKNKFTLLTSSPIDHLTKYKLEELSKNYLLSEKIVILPDIHYKKSDSFPTGIVFEKNKILLSLIQAPNCGMSLVKGNNKELSEEEYIKIFKRLSFFP